MARCRVGGIGDRARERFQPLEDHVLVGEQGKGITCVPPPDPVPYDPVGPVARPGGRWGGDGLAEQRRGDDARAGAGPLLLEPPYHHRVEPLLEDGPPPLRERVQEDADHPSRRVRRGAGPVPSIYSVCLVNVDFRPA
jgi:hypothetical protein